MGFGIIAMFVISFTAGIAAGMGLFAAASEYASTTNAALAEHSSMIWKEAHSDIEIVRVVGNEIYVKNRGSTALDPNYTSLVIDDRWVASSSFSISALGYLKSGFETKIVRGAHFNKAKNTLFLSTRNLTDMNPPWICGVIGWFNITIPERDFVSLAAPPFSWGPGETIKITTAVPIVNKTKVIAENGAWDEYYKNRRADHYHLEPLEGFTSWQWVS